jgi:hypothetical protein
MSASASGSVDITGIDKVVLLRALWTASYPAAYFVKSGRTPPEFSVAQAINAVTSDGIDYFCGRPIKAILSGDTARSTNYDRNVGPGSFERVVKAVREGTTPVLAKVKRPTKPE